jgi:hypothetical protein
MIPHRGIDMKRGCLTMLAYQEAPLIPRVSNVDTARVMAAQAGLPEGGKLKRGRPRLPPKPPKVTRKQHGEALRVRATERLKKKVAELFAKGPLTVPQLRELTGMNSRMSANVKMQDWKRRGLVRESGQTVPQLARGGHGCTYERQLKTWEAV